jgi:hypothetical protein
MADISEFTSLAIQPSSDYRRVEKARNQEGLIQLGIFTFAGMSFVISLVTLAKINTLEAKEVAPLVQTIDGKTIHVRALQGQERPPEVIKAFTENTLRDLFTWRQYLLPQTAAEWQNPKIDLGIVVDAGEQASLKVPSPVWVSSFAVSNSFRQEFLGKHLAPLITGLKVLQGTSTVGFMPLYIQEPIPVPNNHGRKTWKVKIVANLSIRTRPDVPATEVPWDYDVYVEAVSPTTPGLGAKLPDKFAPDLQSAIDVSRASGLQIVGLEPFQRQDLAAPKTSTTPVKPSPATP